MFTHPSLSILAIAAEHHPELRSFFSYLRSISHLELSVNSEIPSDLSPYDVIITAGPLVLTRTAILLTGL